MSEVTDLEPQAPHPCHDPFFLALWPKGIAEKIKEIPVKTLSLLPHQLLSKPTAMDFELRQVLWKELYLVRTKEPRRPSDTPKAMNLSKALVGVLGRSAFYERIKDNPRYLAWLLQEPLNLKRALDANIELGQSRIREILELDLHDDNGKLDHKAAALVLKTYEMLEKRKHGEYVQRVLQKGEVEHTHVEKPKLETVDDIQKRIDELESELKELPEPRAVTSEVSSP